MAVVWIELSWKNMLLRGGIAVVFGIIAMVWPLSTVVALALLWGIWALVDGVVSLTEAFRPGRAGARVLFGLLGVLALVAGVLAITKPGMTAVALTWILGIWLLARGVLDLVLGIFSKGVESRGALILSGLIDFLIGLLFILNPGGSVLGISFVLGLTALIWGIILVVAAFFTRRRLRELESTRTAL